MTTVQWPLLTLLCYRSRLVIDIQLSQCPVPSASSGIPLLCGSDYVCPSADASFTKQLYARNAHSALASYCQSATSNHNADDYYPVVATLPGYPLKVTPCSHPLQAILTRTQDNSTPNSLVDTENKYPPKISLSSAHGGG